MRVTLGVALSGASNRVAHGVVCVKWTKTGSAPWWRAHTGSTTARCFRTKGGEGDKRVAWCYACKYFCRCNVGAAA